MFGCFQHHKEKSKGPFKLIKRNSEIFYAKKTELPWLALQ